VTISGTSYDLPKSFMVLAPEPIEQEGTYPLPEAQLDRFMFCITCLSERRRRSSK